LKHQPRAKVITIALAATATYGCRDPVDQESENKKNRTATWGSLPPPGLRR